MIKLFDLSAQMNECADEIRSGLDEVLTSGQYVLGPKVTEFEESFAAVHQSESAIACSSGTAALHLLLTALEIGPEDEVITVSMTFAATVAAILYVGATPVLVDVDSKSLTLDPHQLETAITKRTKAIIVVHLHGRIADMASISNIAAQHGVPIIEDAAQAHLAKRNGRSVATFGMAAAFSFYPAKNLGACGEGGAVVTSNHSLAARVRELRNWGGSDRYNHERLGFNYRMDAVQGTILSVKLRHLGRWTEKRRQIAKKYELLTDIRQLQTPLWANDEDHVYHVYSLRVATPQKLIEHLASDGIETGRHYPVPVHEQRAYSSRVRVVGNLEETTRFARECVSIPIHPALSDAQQQTVIDSLTHYFSHPTNR